MDIIDKAKKLNLPRGKYAIFGSGPMTIYKIRDSRDVDIIVTKDLYSIIKNNPEFKEKTWDDGDRYLVKDNIGIFHSWNYGEYRPDVDKLIDQAELVEGIPFVPLQEVLKWKKAFGREKDKKDIQLIEKYINSE
ncbi:MAG: hypothetical protein R3346_04605 [Candidatus Spechtbacterales bacterium]|nr:hypothetical protein [Candidatus Spechtbacterales bacterium]